MDEVIWVEVLSRHREVAQRHRCAGPEISIGRGYDNDVVLDDPYVAPRHLRVARDPLGGLVAEDLGSANGLFAGASRQRQARVILDGQPIRIGHTMLQIRDPHHKVVPERVGSAPRHSWPVQLALALTIVGLEIFSAWQRDTGEFKLSHYLSPIELVALSIAGWATVWAVLSRIFSGQAHLERVMLFALCGMLAYSAYNEVSGDIAFSLSWPLPAQLQYVVLWTAVAIVAFLHLRDIGRAHLWLKGGLVGAALVLVVGFQTLSQSESRAVADNTQTTALLPPAARLKPLQTEDRFFSDVLRLKGKLDKARSEDAL